jgi:hypothetical protein
VSPAWADRPWTVIRRQTIDRPAPVKVIHSFPVVSSPVTVVADFNDWDPSATPMRRRRDGQSVPVVLDAGGRYAFRQYHGDPVDCLEDNDVRGTDGIVEQSEPQ